MSRRANVTQAAIKRAIQGAEAAGLRVVRIEVDPAAGKFTIHSGEAAPPPLTPLEAWRRSRGAR